MGAKIESIATAGNRLQRKYLRTGSKAIRSCIKKSQVAPGQLGMIINTGVYPDGYVQEPSFASLLQGKQHLIKDSKSHGTFSFDLFGGGGGLLMAMRILDGFLDSGKITSGLVVAGDTGKIRDSSGSDNYDAHAGAVLLTKDETGKGFVRFAQYSFPEYMDGFSSYTSYSDGELKLFIDESDGYSGHCIQCATEMLPEFLLKEQIELNDIDLFITSQYPAGFASKLNNFFKKDRVIMINGNRRVYSAGMALALDQAIKTDRFSKANRIMFISAGPGITVDMALYDNSQV